MKLNPPFRADHVGSLLRPKALLKKRHELIIRINEAAKYMPLENMCLSPQCGFSSTSHGNELTMDDQWRKLELAVKTAQEVWK